jgi:Polyketide cyclase / dehydrase and lipid transport
VATVTVEQSRAIPIEPRRAFERTLPISLTAICSRWYGLLPPVKEVRGQDGIWGEVGQSRTVVTADGGTMRELLTDVDLPHSFGYRLGEISGPRRPLVSSIDGRWEFAPMGTGTLVTWRWTLYPKGLGTAPLRPIASMWRGYARQVLELLSDQLLATDSA